MEFAIHKPELSLDFALIHIPPLTGKAFIANRVKATNRENWLKQNGLDFSFYRLVGLPEGSVGFFQRPDGTFKRQFNPHSMLIEKIPPTEMPPAAPEGWISGRIHPDVPLIDIVGMSGGPMFGFRQRDDGQWHYFFCAAQSRWDRPNRIVYGCSLPLFGELMHDFLTNTFPGNP